MLELLRTRSAKLSTLGHLLLVLGTFAMPALAEEGTVSGSFIANGTEVVLTHVYVWPEEEGFYDESDPTWTIIFLERALKPTEIGDTVWDSAYVELGITQTASDSGEPELRIYSQSLKLAADSGGNISGGTYPNFEIEGLGTGQVSGRVWLPETEEFFDQTYVYDLSFSAPLSDPNAPIGEPLPAGGGEPGKAYLLWAETLRSGDLQRLMELVPPDQAEAMAATDPEEAEDQMAFMAMMTPSDIEVLGGSSDGEIAVLQVRGSMDGETAEYEVIMEWMDGRWVLSSTSM